MKFFIKLLSLSIIIFLLKSADIDNKSNDKNSAALIGTIHEFQDILKKQDKVIINFFGSCIDCAPGREAFNNFVASLEIEGIKFYEFKVDDKPEVCHIFEIKSRPCVIAFIKGNPQKLKLIRENINNANLEKLISICSEKE